MSADNLRSPGAIIDRSFMYAQEDRGFGLPDLVVFFRRNGFVMLAFTLVGALIGVLHVVTTQPVYVATAEILINPKQPRVLERTNDAGLMQFSIDSSQIESQMEILKSDRISRAVFREHHLDDDPEFRESGSKLIGPIVNAVSQFAKALVSAPGADQQRSSDQGSKIDEEDPSLLASITLANFQQKLNVRRIGQSYVLSISFSSHDAQKAARIANAVAAAYILDQLGGQLSSASDGGENLQGRIDDLRSRYALVENGLKTGQINADEFPSSDGRVITSATVPPGKSFPKTGLVLALGSALGFFLGLIVAVVRRALDLKARTRSDVEQRVGLNFLGVVRRTRRVRGPLQMFTRYAAEPDSSFGEDIRSLRTSIDLMRADNDVRCVGITSCYSREGKSTLICNLAHAYAIDNERIVLLDCDQISKTRISAVLELAGPENPDGSDHGGGRPDEAAFSNTLCKVHNPFGSYQGETEPGVTSQAQVREFLVSLRRQYDLILVDLPALSETSDARALSPQLDGLIIVADCNRTTIPALATAFRLVSKSRVRILGCVLNKAPRSRLRDFQ